jgi:hypothetical protein
MGSTLLEQAVVTPGHQAVIICRTVPTAKSVGADPEDPPR